MKEIAKLTKVEYEVLTAMWSAGRPLTRLEIVSTSSSLKESTVNTILKFLLERGLIQVDSFVRTIKSFARAYVPLITHEEYIVSTISEQRSNVPVDPIRLFIALEKVLSMYSDSEASEEFRMLLEDFEERYRA